MKKKYIVPQAQLISIRQTGNLLVTSGDIYNGGANVPGMLDFAEFQEERENLLNSYFNTDNDIEVW